VKFGKKVENFGNKVENSCIINQLSKEITLGLKHLRIFSKINSNIETTGTFT